jgi:hypothetical protein
MKHPGAVWFGCMDPVVGWKVQQFFDKMGNQVASSFLGVLVQYQDKGRAAFFISLSGQVQLMVKSQY